MEIYLNKGSVAALRQSFSVAKKTAKMSGESPVFHFFDFLCANVFHGCSDNHYQNEGFYKLRSFDRKNTVTKGRKRRICSLFNDGNYTDTFSNKVHFNEVFNKFIRRDWVGTKQSAKEQLSTFIKEHEMIIVKPLNLNKGKGIHLLDKTRPLEIIVDELMEKDWLLEDFIVQHPNMQFENKSVNTIRIISVLDRAGNTQIIKAGLRCGVGGAIVDNFSAGGVFYPLNLKNGFIEGYGEADGHLLYDGKHPGTNITMLGHQIPYWDKVLETINEAAKIVPQVRYVGWDVAILPDGVELIEGNNGPGCTLLECIGAKRGFYKEILSYK